MSLKKTLTLLLAILLCLTVIPIFARADTNNTGFDNDSFYKAVAQLISSRWEDSYFNEATLAVGDDTLFIDNRSIKLDNPAQIQDGELFLPAEVFLALGAELSVDDRGLILSKNDLNVEISYGEINMKINGRKKSLPTAVAPQNGSPVLPASVLNELGAGFEVDYNEATNEITITNAYQMARLTAKFAPGVVTPNIAAEQILEGPEGLFIYQFDTEAKAKAAYETLNSLPDILFVEPDSLVMLEAAPAFALAENIAQTYPHLGWGPERIGADEYLDYLVANGKQYNTVIVAVLDTGLDMAHPYFAGRYVPGFKFIDVNTDDIQSHGTHVSGTVVDVTIALPNVKIMPVKVLGDKGSGTSIGVNNGIRWAADNGANIINMSLGGTGCDGSGDRHDAIDYAINKGVTVVVAAGNDSDDAKRHCPAHDEQAVTVSAFDSANRPASFTNYGSFVDIGAPGVSIVSAIPGGGTDSKNGTSMAAPHVTGAAALLLCDDPSLTPAAIKALLRRHAVPATVNAGDSKYYGAGILNIGTAAGETASRFLVAVPGNITENIYSGAKQKQIAIEYYDNGALTDITSLATYLSSNAAVATVSGLGSVTIRGVGQANILVSYNGYSVTVPVSGISLEPIKVVSVTPANGEENVNLGPVITVTFDKRLSGAIDFTLLDSAGNNTQYIIQRSGDGGYSMTICLRGTLKPGVEYTFTIRAESVRDASGVTLEEDFVSKFTTKDVSVEPLALIDSLPANGAANVSVNTTISLLFNHYITGPLRNITLTDASGKNVATGTQSIGNVVVIAFNEKLKPYTEYTFSLPAGNAECVYGKLEQNQTIKFTTGGDEPDPIPVSSISLPQTGLEVEVNKTAALTATVLPTNATNPQLLWCSNNPDIATVGARDGLITGKTPGLAVIIARATDGSSLSASCIVTVTGSLYEPLIILSSIPANGDTDIALSNTIELNFNQRLINLIAYTLMDSGGNSIGYENQLLYLTGRTVITLNEELKPATEYTFTILAGDAIGEQGILEQDFVMKFSTAGDPAEIWPKSVAVSPITATLAVNDAQQLTATVLPQNAADKTVTWLSGDPAIATVSAGGLVTARAPGAVTITAKTVNGLTATCVVTVIPPLSVTLLTINNASYKNKDAAKSHNIKIDHAGTINISFSCAKNDAFIISLKQGGATLKSQSSANGSAALSYAAQQQGDYEIVIEKTVNGNATYSLVAKIDND